MTSCVVFLGPSLSHQEARAIVGDACDLLPPVKRGDLPSLPSSVRLVAIIDGVFQSEAAVGHREILDLIRKGVKVVGGGSMGALRASELDTMGMLGIGKVYDLYSGGKIDGDDEVALIFNPEDLEALSEPLVNMRHNLEVACARGIIGSAQADVLLAKMKGIYFPKRTKEKLIEEAARALDPSSLSQFEKFVSEDYADIKREDAIGILRYVKKAMKDFAKSTKK
ncbi:MAG: TfuA-related McrA-glycine thioamidation protein [Methanomassiliicoccales archaeon]|nr:TfuA-related McrA-glycine thioamidation protein [Methanomassiliicoccales archaeon]MDD1756675.1 TfuA-related McrA-glycine thioamidation protein [Methanomassiliicoccales archaeon]